MTDEILRFTASYCQPCKMLSKTLETADLGVPIAVVDIEVFPEKADEFGVRSVPVLVYMRNGQEISRKIGMQNVQQLKDWVTLL